MNDIKHYSKDSLKIIAESNFLSDEDNNAIITMADELQDTFEKKQIWRTKTEIDISVLNDIKFPTKAAKYWQCVREQAVFFENLVMLSFEYRRNLVKIEKIKQKLNDTSNPLEIIELQIDLEEANYIKKCQESQAKDRVRELKIWSKKKQEFDDSSFDTSNANNHQLESYTEQFLKKMFIVGNTGSIDERINLEGQLITALKACKEEGLLDNVLNKFTEEQKSVVLKNLEIISNKEGEK